ncbi:MAG: ABC transporter substrate-binding protein, partial [Promicromonosporaceae bacterium]|nr:ABC transporter substrate-binding protein [Promicromonosporaceae bacterium]
TAPTDDAGDPSGSDDATDDPAAELTGDFPRDETLFTIGTMWGPPADFSSFSFTGGATGNFGLIHESLFTFNLDTLELVPWLAESGEWNADNSAFTVVLREGITWTDGQPLTVDDVVWSFEVGQDYETIGWGRALWAASEDTGQPMVTSIDVDGNTITFNMGDSRPEQWTNIMYTRPIFPQHIMGEWDSDELMTSPFENPVGSGPFTLHSYNLQRVVYERNDNWWGAEVFNPMPMRFIVDLVNTSNEIVIGMLQQGQIDLSNNFLPGIDTLIAQGLVHTYFDEAPWMLSANTAVLIPNHERAPMNDPAFRRALASSIDVDSIITFAFGGLVQSASPTGLLPVFDRFVNTDLVAQHGFTFDVAEAVRIMEEAGYVRDGDYFLGLDGNPMEVELIVPAGWTDWMDAATQISESAAAAGINVRVDFPDAASLDERRAVGDFDLVINNWSQVSNTPFIWWSYVYHWPVADSNWTGNFGHFDAAEISVDVTALARTVQGSPEFNAINDRIQENMLTELPMIPLWYNGLWAQWSENVWTGWPSPANPTGWPSTWHGYWQLGMVNVLLGLTPAG